MVTSSTVRVSLLSISAWLLLLCSAVRAGSPFGSITSKVREGFAEQAAILNPWDKDEDEDTSIIDTVLPVLSATGTSLYGAALLLFFRDCPGQIHFLTMMRSNGFAKIETGIRKARRNIRDAKWSAVRHAPSFVMVTRSMTQLQTRVDTAKKRVQMAKQARADGVVTRKESRRLKKAEQKHIRNIKRDMRRLATASSSIKKVWEALDVDEIMDLSQQFMFQLMAVLATGHNGSKIGKFISRWCLFQNLGGLVNDTNQKLGFPISRLILTRSLSSKDIDKKKAQAIENTAKATMYSTSGLLVATRLDVAQRLNGAFLSSAIVLRGLRSFVGIFWDRTDDDVTVWRILGNMLEGAPGGVLMVSLVAIGMYCNKLERKGKLKAPKWILTPLRAIDKGIQRLATAIDEAI